MSTENQPRQNQNTLFEIGLLLVVVVLAWPALLLGAITRLGIKNGTTNAQLSWVLTGIFGGACALFLYLYVNPYLFLLVLFHDVAPLFLHIGGVTFRRFLVDALPVWERSVLLFPLCALVIELFSHTSLEQTLLSQERQRQARQTQKSKQSAIKVRKAPDHINGKGVLGALIEDLNT